MIDPDDWAAAAACRGMLDLFFAPETPESRTERAERESRAKAVCGVCEVRLECLDTAIASRERFGIWGGLNERERRSVRRAGVRASADQADPTSPQDTAGPGRLARLPAVVARGRRVSSMRED